MAKFQLNTMSERIRIANSRFAEKRLENKIKNLARITTAKKQSIVAVLRENIKQEIQFANKDGMLN